MLLLVCPLVFTYQVRILNNLTSKTYLLAELQATALCLGLVTVLELRASVVWLLVEHSYPPETSLAGRLRACHSRSLLSSKNTLPLISYV